MFIYSCPPFIRAVYKGVILKRIVSKGGETITNINLISMKGFFEREMTKTFEKGFMLGLHLEQFCIIRKISSVWFSRCSIRSNSIAIDFEEFIGNESV